LFAVDAAAVASNDRKRMAMITAQNISAWAENKANDGSPEGERRLQIDDIKKHILQDNYIITFHAHRRMDERCISTDDIVDLILNGRIIEDYPGSKPCPSALVAGNAGGTCYHAVVALCKNHLRIITVYRPEDGEWTRNMTRRGS